MTPHHRVQQPGFRQVLAVREFRVPLTVAARDGGGGYRSSPSRMSL